MIFLKNNKRAYALMLAALLALAGGLNASGLLTPFTECRLENVEPGKAYNLKSASGHMLKIKNTSQKPVTVVVSVEKPPKGNIKENYEVIPDIKWITVKKNKFDINPGSWGETELILTVPRRGHYYGRNFQASVSVRTDPGGGENTGNLSVGLRSNIFVKVKEKEGFMRKVFGWFFGKDESK